MRRKLKKSLRLRKYLLALSISVVTVFTLPDVIYAETINGYTRQDYSSYYNLPPEEWTDSGIYTTDDGAMYYVGKYDASVDRRTVSCVSGGQFSGQVGYADANMNMVVPFTNKWDSVEDFYKGRAMTSNREHGVDTAGNGYDYDIKYLIDINGNVLNEIKLKRSNYNDYEKESSVITTDGEKYATMLTGLNKYKELNGIDLEVIKYSNGSYNNYFYSFKDNPFLIDRYNEGAHGNKLMLSDFDENGVATLTCYDTDSWEYHQPIGLGDTGWSYTRSITLGKITIWGTVIQ